MEISTLIILAVLAPVFLMGAIIALDKGRGETSRRPRPEAGGVSDSAPPRRPGLGIRAGFEWILLSSRWLLAPFLLVLALGLIALLYNEAERAWSLFQDLAGREEHITVRLLSLIDLTLEGALVVIIILSVYQNFVSRLDVNRNLGLPDSVGQVEFSGLQLRLLSTIVAISAIRLLEAFLDLPDMKDRDVYFYIGIHLTFVATTAVLALVQRLAKM